jgi:hypothetical protein
MYPVTIKNAEGKIKEVISSAELSAKHWGVNKLCRVCKNIFFPKTRRGSQGIVLKSVATWEADEPKGNKPNGNVCSPACNKLEKARKRTKSKPPPIKTEPCGVCGTIFPISRVGHKYCSYACRKKKDLQRATERNKKLKVQRMEKKKILKRGEEI